MPYWANLGRHRLKWERHTEFLTYSLFVDDQAAEPFSMSLDFFPESWRQAAPGEVVTASMVHICESTGPDLQDIEKYLEKESLAVASVLDKDAVIASDFRIDGHGAAP